jgi:hypothetical protein
MFCIELVVVTQELTRLEIAGGVNSISGVPSHTDRSQDAVGLAGVINKATKICFDSCINVPASIELHDVEIWIVGVILRPACKAFSFCIFIDYFAHVFLDEVALLESFECNKTPTLSLLPLRLAFSRLTKAKRPVPTIGSYITVPIRIFAPFTFGGITCTLYAHDSVVAVLVAESSLRAPACFTRRLLPFRAVVGIVA